MHHLYERLPDGSLRVFTVWRDASGPHVTSEVFEEPDEFAPVTVELGPPPSSRSSQ
jgi:hypothetical protein